jgi:hypothetical protein
MRLCAEVLGAPGAATAIADDDAAVADTTATEATKNAYQREVDDVIASTLRRANDKPPPSLDGRPPSAIYFIAIPDGS